MKSLAKLFGFVSVVILAATISSCSNFMSDSQSSQSKSGAYITFSSDDMARTVFPDTQSTVLKDFVLKGLKDGESEQKTLGSWATKSAFQNAVVPVDLGEWMFTLSAYGDGTKFEGSVQKTIVLGENRLLFELEISDGGSEKGSFGITLSFDEATNASSIAYAIAVFETIDGESVAGVESQTLTPANKAVTFAASNIPAGTYRARVRFYSQGFEVGSYREIVQIASGLCSAASRTIESFDELYTITYVLNGGSFAAGSTAQETFSRKSVVALPAENEIVRDNYKFLGWYTDESFSNESKIEKIENTAKNITLYARYAKRYATVGGLECWSCDETVAALLAATGDITVTLYSDVTADEIGKSGYTVDEVDGTLSSTAVESNTIASAIARTSADSVALIVDPPAGIKLNEDSSFIFAGCSKLVSADLRGLDTSSATIIAAMFAHCDNLATLNVSGFDTSNVTDMRAVFFYCNKLEALDVSGFNTSKVTNMFSMFCRCNSLAALDVSGFNTANVTNMRAMFAYCESLADLDVSNFDTANVTDMRSMFWNCSSLLTLDVSNFDTANVTDMSSMFCHCDNLLTLDVSSFDTSKVKNMSYMFNSSPKLEIIYASEKFVTSAVTEVQYVFWKNEKLVGQAGTKYANGKQDAAYACIDGGSEAPGYFYNSDIKVYADKDGKGIRFSVNRKPATWGGKELNYFIIYCYNSSGKEVMRVKPKLDGNSERVECLYPLCGADECCNFRVQIQYLDDEVAQNDINKSFKVTSIGGSGGFDFSSTESSCSAKYNNDGKPQFDIIYTGYPSPLIAKETVVAIFATDNWYNWGTDNIQYFHAVGAEGLKNSIVVENVEEFNSNFLYRSDNGARTKFFAEGYVVFDIDSSTTENTIAEFQSCRFASNAVDIRMPVSIDVAVKNSDISVTKTQDGNSVIFTAEKCDSYSWTLDDKVVGTARSCVIDTSTLAPGTYSLALEAKKGSKIYSYWAQLKCEYDAGGQSSNVSQLPGDDFDEKLFTTDRLQTSHVKVENVAGGLKFTITRPEGDLFNPNYVIRTEEDEYEYVHGGNGDYFETGVYVGAGNGDCVFDWNSYPPIGQGYGDYVLPGIVYVGEGKGVIKKVAQTGGSVFEYVGEGKGNLNFNKENLRLEDVGDGNGCYKINEGSFEWVDWDYDKHEGRGEYVYKGEYVGDGKGDVVRQIICHEVGEGQGDYKQTHKYIGEGKGDFKKGKNIYGGFSWAAIARYEYVNGELNDWASVAELPAWDWDDSKNEFTCLYPLCEPGERYVFLVQLEPRDVDNHREDIVKEFISVIALDGVGDIDYSYLSEERKVDLQFDGTKPIATALNFTPPENITDFDPDFDSVFEFFAGTNEFKTGTTYNLGQVKEKGFVKTLNKDYWNGKFEDEVRKNGKSQFFVNYWFQFQVPGSEGICAFRATGAGSDYVYLEP
ncbi:MAG: BspA family leucine-rich repeat surface protein [Treponema sp.]|nr:BspA family leucine-rich repeat surface protein [Treponema sp.]MEE3434017.1 BspA family leucine-rich repeat surface protein [Treponema sp.]